MRPPQPRPPLPNAPRAPIATGTTKPAASSAPGSTKANPHRQPNSGPLSCEVVATISGSEKPPAVVLQVSHGSPFTSAESSPARKY